MKSIFSLSLILFFACQLVAQTSTLPPVPDRSLAEVNAELHHMQYYLQKAHVHHRTGVELAGAGLALAGLANWLHNTSSNPKDTDLAIVGAGLGMSCIGLGLMINSRKFLYQAGVGPSGVGFSLTF